jgi:flagellar motor switch protein FliM
MVNGPSELAPERRERARAGAEHAPALGAAPNLNPFGDLVTLQHLSARLARTLRGVFEPVLRQDLRVWAEPLVVQRWADYREERGAGLTAFVPIEMGTSKGRTLLVMQGALVLEMLDRFFGGDGEVETPLPGEFTPAAEAVVTRLIEALVPKLELAWEPVTRIPFAAAPVLGCHAAPQVESEEAMIVTRFGLAAGNAKPVHVDILYPVAALKPHASSITTKMRGRAAEAEPAWRSGLTRAVMNVRMPVRSVLAEPVVPLGLLMDLKVGDVLPVELSQEVPVFVAKQRLGTGQVGTANGKAAIKLIALEPLNPEDFQ